MANSSRNAAFTNTDALAIDAGGSSGPKGAAVPLMVQPAALSATADRLETLAATLDDAVNKATAAFPPAGRGRRRGVRARGRDVR